MRIKQYKSTNSNVYQIKLEHSEREIVAQRRKFVLFNAFMHTAYICTIMATALYGIIVYIQYDTL